MSDIDELIDELSNIELRAPSRILDGRIFKAVAGEGDWSDEFDGVWHRRDSEDSCAFDAPPNYTSSMDEAMKLVPEMDMQRSGVWWRIQQSGGSNGSGKNFYIAHVWVALDTKTEEYVGMGPAAIALSTAALKARRGLAVPNGDR